MHWQRLNSLLLVVQYSTVLCVYNEVVVRNDQRGGAPADRMKIGHEIWCQDQPIRPGGHAPEDVRLPISSLHETPSIGQAVDVGCSIGARGEARCVTTIQARKYCLLTDLRKRCSNHQLLWYHTTIVQIFCRPNFGSAVRRKMLRRCTILRNLDVYICMYVLRTCRMMVDDLGD